MRKQKTRPSDRRDGRWGEETGNVEQCFYRGGQEPKGSVNWVLYQVKTVMLSNRLAGKQYSQRNEQTGRQTDRSTDRPTDRNVTFLSLIIHLIWEKEFIFENKMREAEKERIEKQLKEIKMIK